MNGFHVKLSRELLNLNQTELASELGWTSKRNVVYLEQNKKPVTKQTELALECLLRRTNKFNAFQCIEANQAALNMLLEQIKLENESSGTAIAQNDDNETLLSIFAKVEGIYPDLSIEDDESNLINNFGQDGYSAIRDAENGIY